MSFVSHLLLFDLQQFCLGALARLDQLLLLGCQYHHGVLLLLSQQRFFTLLEYVIDDLTCHTLLTLHTFRLSFTIHRRRLFVAGALLTKLANIHTFTVASRFRRAIRLVVADVVLGVVLVVVALRLWLFLFGLLVASRRVIGSLLFKRTAVIVVQDIADVYSVLGLTFDGGHARSEIVRVRSIDVGVQRLRPCTAVWHC